MESILTSIKLKMLIAEDDPSFDETITIAINNAFFKLKQLGVGPEEGIAISGAEDTWEGCGIQSVPMLNALKTYIFISVKLEVDPPQSTALMECYNRQMDELSFRLMVESEELTEGESNE